MYKKKLWKPIMAGTLALTMFVTPLSTVSTVSAAEMETAGTEALAETSAEDTEEEDTAETETTEEAIPEAASPEIDADGEVESEKEADTAEGDILLDEEHFPDANFRNYLSTNADTNGDGTLSKAERDACTSIDVNEKNIGSLTGVEYFTELTELKCAKNNLTNLDVSANKKLESLLCYNNELTSLDVKENTELTILSCGTNELTSLDVSANTDLTFFSCHSNSLTSLSISENTELTTLNCHSNLLTTLNISANTKLTTLNCYSNRLTSLDLSTNTEMTTLKCYYNSLTSLNVSASTKLTEISCAHNHLTSLDVSGNTNLTRLYCYNNQLTNLDVSTNTELTDLQCNHNQLTSLDLNTNLTNLYCYDNQLTSLDVSASTELIAFYCQNNQLTSLDLSTNTKLRGCDCSNNIYYAKLNAERKYDLSTLPGSGPDVSKMSDITGGTLSGTILTFNEGSDAISYTYDCANDVSETFTIKEFKAVQTITLNKTSASVLKDRTLRLNATVAPSDASIQNVAWTTSNSNVATVSPDGLVVAKELGTTMITAPRRMEAV